MVDHLTTICSISVQFLCYWTVNHSVRKVSLVGSCFAVLIILLPCLIHSVSQPQPTHLVPSPSPQPTGPLGMICPTFSVMSSPHLHPLHPTGPPSLPLLLAFPAHGTSINIIQKIGTNYPTFGTFLLNDLTGEVVDGLRQEYLANAENINRALFQKWLRGTSCIPISWSALVNVLRQSNLHALADQIEAVTK